MKPRSILDTVRSFARGSAFAAGTSLAMGALLSLGTSCASDGFGRVRATHRLDVELIALPGEDAPRTGTLTEPLALQVDTPVRMRVVVRARTLDGALDTSFSRYVRLAVKPGTIAPVEGEAATGRNILVVAGESPAIDIDVVNAFGVSYVIAEDLGYVPVDPLRDPPPACSDGIDNDGDGRVDFPADPGCAFPNDDAEEGGTYIEGASQPIYFTLPRIAQVRGRACIPAIGCFGNGFTPFPKQQIQIDTGFDAPIGIEDVPAFRFSTVVTRIASDGFYASDISDAPNGFNDIFAFNFNPPPRMRVCDRLKTFGGTANEFFGFTQISYPTWTLEEWNPTDRVCLVPNPTILLPGIVLDTSELGKLSGSLVRAESSPNGAATINVTRKLGPGFMPCRVGGRIEDPLSYDDCDVEEVGDLRRRIFVPEDNATNCDLDGSGSVTFEQGNPENDCATACRVDPECTEYSNFAARGTFRLTIRTGSGIGAVQADASASQGFDAMAMRGTPIRSFTGTLHYFSGGQQYTVEARCKDDIVFDLEASPFANDRTCTSSEECTAGYECLPLRDGTQACRARSETSAELTPPPLACVAPRTFAENNPQ